jgi:hypothetical protein
MIVGAIGLTIFVMVSAPWAHRSQTPRQRWRRGGAADV